MINLHELTLVELEEYLVERKFKKFNARQIYEWVYKKKALSFFDMSNLSKSLRDFLSKNFYLGNLKVQSHQVSQDGTEKLLLELQDGEVIETVLMKHKYGTSVCVTTQLGCNIGCAFCASGLQKKKRDLTAGEIVEQVLMMEQITDERISHIVVMGIGEPFDNYDNTMRFVDIVNNPYGLEIGARHITISTSGLVPKILKFSDEPKQVNLAISLHASNDKVRSSIMKINDTYNIKELIEAARYYVEKTNRRITFEYILLEKVNDDIKYADELSSLLRGINCYVNLIRYNSVNEFNYRGSSEKRANAFYSKLQSRGINTTLRREKGSDIDAACGQLRSKNI